MTVERLLRRAHRAPESRRLSSQHRRFGACHPRLPVRQRPRPGILCEFLTPGSSCRAEIKAFTESRLGDYRSQFQDLPVVKACRARFNSTVAFYAALRHSRDFLSARRRFVNWIHSRKFPFVPQPPVMWISGFLRQLACSYPLYGHGLQSLAAIDEDCRHIRPECQRQVESSHRSSHDARTGDALDVVFRRAIRRGVHSF